MNIKLKNHICITASADIDQIVRPVKEFFGFNYINYGKNFNDGSEIRLTNHPAWAEFFYQNKLYTRCSFHAHPKSFKKEHIVNIAPSSFAAYIDDGYDRLTRDFDMDHDILFINPCDDGCEFFCMNAPRDHPEVMARYLPHIDLLERFFDYFKERAAPIIQQALKQRIYIPNKYVEARPIISEETLNREEFLNALNLRNPFTPRETDCARLLIKGHTHKMIAQTLQISPRTVNAHIEHIKQKANISSKAGLLKYIDLKLYLH